MASSTSYALSKNIENLLTLAETMDKDDVKEMKGTTQDPTLPFYTEDGFTDVILEVDGEMLYTNRSLLAYASPVFACMFTAEFKEKHEKTILLPNKEILAISELLCFLHPGIDFAITRDCVFRLIPLAEEYQISVLKSGCEEFLLQDLKKQLYPTVDFIMKCLALAEQCLLPTLRAKCITRLSDPDICLRLLKANEDISLETKAKIYERRIDKMEKERSDVEVMKSKIISVKQRLKEIINPHDDHCRCRIEVKLRSPIQRNCPYCSRTWCSDTVSTDAYKNCYQYHCNHKIGYHVVHDATVRSFLEQVDLLG